MEIQKIGNHSFYIKGKKENVLVNPTNDQMGLKKYEARIVAISQESFDGKEWSDGKVFLRGPGEYEVGGIDVLGINSGVKSTIYIFSIDGVSVCYLGDLKEPLSDKKIERIEDVDVLLAPVNAEKLGDGKNVLDWAKKWGANYIVPFGYDDQKEDLKKFMDAADIEGKEPIESLKLTGKEEFPDGTEVVILV